MSDLLLERVELEQGRRIRGGLLSGAEDLPEGWEQGITFRAYGCAEPEILGVCDVGDSMGVRPGEAPEFAPIYIRQSAACATLSRVGTVDIARTRLESTSEWALGRLLATGLGTANPSFDDAELVGLSEATSADLAVVEAVSCLEQAASDYGFGAEVVLHAPAKAAAYLATSGLNIDGQSPMGFKWILSPGYPGGTEVDSGVQVNLWATGTVFAAVNEPQVLQDPTTGKPPVGWRTNLDEAYSQRLGLAAFDPCLNLTAGFVVPDCNGES